MNSPDEPSPPDTPLLAARSHGAAKLDPDARLSGSLGRAPHKDELTLWAGMPTDRRELAMLRIAVLRRWVDEPGEMTAAEAAGQAQVKVSRFYEIAAAWKAEPTLQSLGAFAKRPGRSGPRLAGDVVNTIQSILPELVKVDEHAKIATIVDRLQSHPALRDASLPHVNTLRTMVQREKRRLKGEKQAGGRPGFDAVACELLRPDGSYHVVFAVVDRTSRLLLGFSVGTLDESRSAYARAAQDALDRIVRPDAQRIPWADTTTRIDVIVGEDPEAWASTRAEYGANPFGLDFGLVEKGRRYGRYLKMVAGDAIGGMRIFPARTDASALPEAGHRFSDAEATTAIEVEVARHNAEVLAESVAQGAARPAPVTMRILEFIARG